MSHETNQPPSTALLAAQQRLFELRLSLPARAERPERSRPAMVQPSPDQVQQGQALLDQRRRREAYEQGGRASDALKAAHAPAQPATSRHFPGIVPAARAASNKNTGRTAKVYPSLAAGMLKTRLAAPGRVYWLLKWLDQQGKGWLAIDIIREQLTDHTSKLKVYGWRRLRQILNQGEGVLWERDGQGRLWLYGAAKTAQKLGITGRLEGFPIALPVTTLLGPIKAVKAHFYASFHSGRKASNPISRQRLEQLTGVPERTQRDYDQVARVERKENIAVGERYTKANMETRAWRQGRGVFQFVDVEGQQGKAGREYIAWRLPNSYQGPHSQSAKGRQKKVNQQLTGLVMKGMRGNGQGRIDRVFWPHGAAAGRAYTRDQRRDAYWPGGETRVRRYNLWNVLAGAGG